MKYIHRTVALVAAFFFADHFHCDYAKPLPSKQDTSPALAASLAQQCADMHAQLALRLESDAAKAQSHFEYNHEQMLIRRATVELGQAKVYYDLAMDIRNQQIASNDARIAALEARVGE